MSIKQALWDRRSEGRLVQFAAKTPADPNLRALYLTKELPEELIADRGDLDELERYAQLEADLHLFISNKLIGPRYLKGLDPASNGVWEIRSRMPRPSIRVFCLFVEKDCLICTHHVLRKDLGGYRATIRMRSQRQSR